MRPLIPIARTALAAMAAVPLLACDDDGMEARFTDIGEPDKGAAIIELAGCGTCHQIPGIDEAGGLVGPPLNGIGDRIFIAGVLRNTPANMMNWLQDPQAVVPGNAMPDMGLTDEQTRHVTAYLYTLDAR